MKNNQNMQINRLQYMENLLDQSLKLLSELNDMTEKLDSLTKMTKELSEYYEGPLWRQDFEDDEKGLIPRGLKRGVLSEDAIYNLLDDVKELSCELEATINNNK